MRRAVPIFVGICLLAAAGPAAAKFCGDAVNGQDIACACGDIVVSDLKLTDDPVTGEVCRGDGLVVRASTATAGLVIDLNGRTLRGAKRGAGVWVVAAGPGGARVISSGGRAAIEGFRDGVSARGEGSIALVENLDVRDTARDGVTLGGGDYEIRAVTVTGAGRDGISLDGHDYRCHGTRVSRSRRFGYFLNGQNAIVGQVQNGNTAEQSGNDGFHLMGSGFRLNLCTSTGNGRDGVTLRGSGHELTGCAARGNAHSGIVGDGGNLGFFNNRADDNGRNGLAVTGLRLVDGGGNSGSGNRGEGSQRPATQCEIGGTPCKP
jgi:hypothetical protein